MEFLAIDFETADFGRDSACAVGLVRVRDGEIIDRCTHLIRPPRRNIYFTYIHGITWEDVAGAPTFGELWPRIEPFFRGVEFLVAHNASFDRGVLHACCMAHGIRIPSLEFHCTVKLARKLWGLRPANLPAVCKHFNIPLNHHDAGSDTEACARIMIEALKVMNHGPNTSVAPPILSGRNALPAVIQPEQSVRKRLVLRRLKTFPGTDQSSTL